MPMDLKETETELPECSWFGSFHYYYLQPWLVVSRYVIDRNMYILNGMRQATIATESQIHSFLSR